MDQVNGRSSLPTETEQVSAERLFPSFFMGGFECSTHTLASGRRLDLIRGTQHDRFVAQDYYRLAELGLRVARDGIRWNLIEVTPGRFDFSSVVPMVRAARQTGLQVIWDLLHFGWPDGLDIFQPEFLTRFARFVHAAAEFFRNESDGPYWFTPVNEISFFAWAGGTEGCINPFAKERGMELKTQLVRSAIVAMETIREVIPEARFTLVEPIIHVVPTPGKPEEVPVAAARNASKYESWDMLAGRAWPQLGGDPKYLDLVGVNFYPHNEWLLSEEGCGFIRTDHPSYKPFRELLADVFARYGKPLYISETGTEDAERVPWLRYVCEEVFAAMESGIPIEGICLYPIVNHPGWVDDRHCYNGLWDYADERGQREIYEPLEAEIHRWQQVFDARNRDRISPQALNEMFADAENQMPPLQMNGSARPTGPLGDCAQKNG
jgi:hypothetical protein